MVVEWLVGISEKSNGAIKKPVLNAGAPVSFANEADDVGEKTIRIPIEALDSPIVAFDHP